MYLGAALHRRKFPDFVGRLSLEGSGVGSQEKGGAGLRNCMEQTATSTKRRNGAAFQDFAIISPWSQAGFICVNRIVL